MGTGQQRMPDTAGLTVSPREMRTDLAKFCSFSKIPRNADGQPYHRHGWLSTGRLLPYTPVFPVLGFPLPQPLAQVGDERGAR